MAATTPLIRPTNVPTNIATNVLTGGSLLPTGGLTGFTPPPTTSSTTAAFLIGLPGGLSTLMIVGIALGVFAGLLLIIVVCCLVGYCCCRRTTENDVTKIRKIYRYREKPTPGAAVTTVKTIQQEPAHIPSLVLDASITSHACKPKVFNPCENDKRLVPSATVPSNTTPSAIYPRTSPCGMTVDGHPKCTRLIPSTPLPPPAPVAPISSIYPAVPTTNDINVILPTGNFQQQTTSSQVDNDIHVIVVNPGNNNGVSAPTMGYGYDQQTQYGSKTPLGPMGFQTTGGPVQYGGFEPPYHEMYPSTNQLPQSYQQMNQYGAMTSSTGYLFPN